MEKKALRETQNLRVGWIKAAQILCTIEGAPILSIW